MAGDRLVAIHQPNFFPWLGYFSKAVRADVFIVLDDVQFARTGAGTWSNRVRVLINGEPSWITMPIRRPHQLEGLQRYDQIRVDNTQRWREKLLRTIQVHYRRAASFDEVFPAIEPLVMHPAESLVEYNLFVTSCIARRLYIDPERWVLASTLHATATGTARLIELVRAADGTAYLSGDGAGGYQDDDAFASAGLGLVRQHFAHPVYDQRSGRPFVEGMSCIDALMHCGFDRTRALLG